MALTRSRARAVRLWIVFGWSCRQRTSRRSARTTSRCACTRRFSQPSRSRSLPKAELPATCQRLPIFWGTSPLGAQSFRGRGCGQVAQFFAVHRGGQTSPQVATCVALARRGVVHRLSALLPHPPRGSCTGRSRCCPHPFGCRPRVRRKLSVVFA